MARRVALTTVVLLTALVGPTPLTRAQPARTAKPPAGQRGVIDERAEAALRRMSDYLTGLKSFRVEVTTIDEMVTKDGQKIQQLKESRVTLRRPNGLHVDRLGPAGHVTFSYDGKQFAVASAERHIFATAPAPPTLAAAIDTARDRLQIDAPGADLLVPRPYEALTDGLVTGHYIGREPIGGEWAHHVAVTKGVVDWQIWIRDGKQPVPLRYVITTKDVKGRPQFTVELRNWQPNAAVPQEQFSFTPPPGSRKVEFTASAKASPQG